MYTVMQQLRTYRSFFVSFSFIGPIHYAGMLLFRIQTGFRTYWRHETSRPSSATAKSTARPSCLVCVLYDINHFSVMGHESYRIRRNNAKLGPYAARRSRSFKVTDIGTNRKPVSKYG